MKGHVADEAIYSLLNEFKVGENDVSDFTDSYEQIYRTKAHRESKRLRDDATCTSVQHTQADIQGTTSKLRADVD